MIRLFFTSLACIGLLGCTGAQALVPTVADYDTSLPSPPAGSLTLPDAWRLTDQHHPELVALRQAVRAVNLTPGPEDASLIAKHLDGNARDLAIEGELLSLFGVGPRAALGRLAFAQRLALMARVRTRQWELAAELAEAFAEVEALDALADPGGDFQIDAFEAAGLVAGGTLDAARSTLAEAEAERAVRSVLRQEALRRIGERIGAAPPPIDVPWTFSPTSSRPWLASLGEPVRLSSLVCRHRALREALADYNVADRALRLAVSEQLPGVVLRLGGDIELDAPLQLLRIRIPLGAPARARTAKEERLRAFFNLRSTAHQVRHEAEAARLGVELRAAERTGAAAAVGAAGSLRKAAVGRVDVDSNAVAGAILALASEVQAARRLRVNSLAHARAEIRAAKARGWPYPNVLAPHMRGAGDR